MQLSGTLAGASLPTIVRFLTGLKKSGWLRIALDDWRGEVLFEGGQVTWASFGSHAGFSAFDALVQTLPEARFAFESDASATVGGQGPVRLSRQALPAPPNELAGTRVKSTQRLPSLDAVPQLIEHDDSATDADQLPLDRATLLTLLGVDGKRTVREIVAQRRSFDALWQLSALVQLDLIRLMPPPLRIEPVTPAAPPSSEVATTPVDRLRVGGLEISHVRETVTLDGQTVQLTPIEYRLLVALASRPDEVLSREMLGQLVWGNQDLGTGHLIDVHIGRLRLKLRRAPPSGPVIVTVRGKGYTIDT